MWVELGVIASFIATYFLKEMFHLTAPMYIGLFALLIILVFQKM